MFSLTVRLSKGIFLKDEAQIVFAEISGLSLTKFFNMGFPHDNMPAGRNVDCR